MRECYNESDHADIAELGKILNALQQATNNIRRELTRKKEAARLEAKQRLVVSDHAVVRFLERARGLDIEAVRAEINDIADGGVRFKNIEDAVWNAEHLLTIVIDDGMVVTVLSADQSEKYIGRSLVNGERASA